MPAKPRKTAKAATADLRHGEALCYLHCQKDLAFALPQSAMPTFIESAHAAGLSTEDLVAAVAANVRQPTQ